MVNVAKIAQNKFGPPLSPSVDILYCCGILLAKIWQTGADRPSTIAPSMWPDNSVIVWQCGPNLGQIYFAMWVTYSSSSYSSFSSSSFLPSDWGSVHSGCSWIHQRSAWQRSWCRSPQPAAGYQRGRKMMPGHRSRTGNIWYWKSHRGKNSQWNDTTLVRLKNKDLREFNAASLTRTPWPHSPERCGRSKSQQELRSGPALRARSHKIMPCQHSTARWPPGTGRALPQCTGHSNHNNLRGHNISAHRRHTPHI